MELTIESIKQLMQLMTENRISTLQFGELRLEKTSSEPLVKTSPTTIKHLDIQEKEEKQRQEFEARAVQWSMTGTIPPALPKKR